MREGQIPSWIRAPLVIGTFGWLLWHELRKPLRTRQRESKLTRDVRNFVIAATAGLTMQLLEIPAATALSRNFVLARGWGLLPWMRLPPWLETTLAILLLDYTLYLWHRATHKVPFLWRFHAAHHLDLDLDASTALRFHFGEIACSVAWRAAQMVAIGVTPWAYSIWQTGLVMEILFHHSNARLPLRLEKIVTAVLVTPRMHGIHHSIVRSEMDSNWSSGLSWWDRLHGTFRLDVPQQEIVIGLAAYQEPADVTLGKTLALPFEADRSALLR